MTYRVLLALVLPLAFIVISGTSMAEEPHTYQYAAKFVCGKSEGKIVAPGGYFSAINVHNPTDAPIKFRKKIAIALPNDALGPVSNFFSSRLDKDGAVEIDCPEIFERVRSREPFLKGFVVIESQTELDVVVVYTAAGDTGRVETLHLDRVPPRKRAGCPDLVVMAVEKPVWDSANDRSVIRATIANIGTATAGPTIARVIDPTTSQPSGAPHNDISVTPPLGPGDVSPATFHLLYWVYNPDAKLEVTADYKKTVVECNEDNNVLIFDDKD